MLSRRPRTLSRNICRNSGPFIIRPDLRSHACCICASIIMRYYHALWMRSLTVTVNVVGLNVLRVVRVYLYTMWYCCCYRQYVYIQRDACSHYWLHLITCFTVIAHALKKQSHLAARIGKRYCFSIHRLYNLLVPQLL